MQKLNNPNIVRAELGKGKPFYQQVPGEEFVYGKPVPHDRENAVDCKFKDI
jgi:hypothetical protein